jgi:hypothetical protein
MFIDLLFVQRMLCCILHLQVCIFPMSHIYQILVVVLSKLLILYDVFYAMFMLVFLKSLIIVRM